MSIERMSSNDSVEAGVRVTPTVVENDYLAMLFLHSTAGDTSAAAQKLSEVAGQYTDARLTMKGQDGMMLALVL